MKWHIDSTKLVTHNKLVMVRSHTAGGIISYEEYFLNGNHHNPNGPAIKRWYKGKPWYNLHYINGIRIDA